MLLDYGLGSISYQTCDYGQTTVGVYTNGLGSYQGIGSYQTQTFVMQQTAATSNWYQNYLIPTIITYISNCPMETPEELEVRKLRAAQEAKKREDAARRAEELLFMCIGEKHKKQYTEHKYFDVEVNGKTYRIHKGRSGNISQMEGEKVKSKYCAHPSDWFPDGDTVLAQFLMLTTDEKKFLGIANELAA